MQQGLTWVAGESTPRKVYLTRVWNFGTWNEWQEAWEATSRPEMLDAARHPLRGHWTRRGKAFAETLCGLSMPDDVLLSYDA